MKKPEIIECTDSQIILSWETVQKAEEYRIYWADKNTKTMRFECIGATKEREMTVLKSTHIPHYFKVAAMVNGKETELSEAVSSPIKKVFHEQLESLNRGLVAVRCNTGIFLSWRLFLSEVRGYTDTGLSGANFAVYRNGVKIAVIKSSTNFIDKNGTMEDTYQVSPIIDGVEQECCQEVKAWKSGENFLEIPLKKPENGKTPAGEEYCYHANDTSIR